MLSNKPLTYGLGNKGWGSTALSGASECPELGRVGQNAAVEGRDEAPDEDSVVSSREDQTSRPIVP